MLADFTDLVDDLVRDAAQWVTSEQRERAIGLALARYSADRPREIVEDITLPGGAAVPLPLGWAQTHSAVRGIEAPVGSELLGDAWRLNRTPLGEEIRLVGYWFDAGLIARVRYSAPHLLNSTEDTIPQPHREAVACYAASLLAEQVATVHANASDATIAADSVDKAHPAREWAKRAQAYRARYFATLGIQINAQGVEQPRIEAAGVVVDLDLPSLHGRGRLYRR